MSPAYAGPPEPPLHTVFKPMMPRIWVALFVSSVVALLSLAPSVYMLEVYDRVINSRNVTTLVMLSLAVVWAYAVTELLDWVRSETMMEVGHEADRQITPRLFRGMFHANLRALPGGHQQAMNDWAVVRDFLHSPFVLALFEIPVALVFLVLVYLIHPLLGWLALAGGVVQVGLAWLANRTTQPPLMAANRSSAQAQHFAEGFMRNAEVVEAMGMLRSIHARWLNRQREFLGLQAKASTAAGTIQAITRVLQMVVGSALLGFSAWLFLRNSFNGSPGLMIVVSIIGGRALAPLVQMVAQWQLVLNARESWVRLNALLSGLPETAPAMPLPAPQGNLTVEQLVAGAPALPGRPSLPILRGIHFAVAPGEVLAVIGPSASGKTTLARVLMGVWAPFGGSVRLDHVDIASWNKEELGPHLGYLPQGVELFEGTVAENIARFGAVDMVLVEEAAALVGMNDLIRALPQGYDTPVGRDGAALSGGQRQRIALARALYGQPALIVLDEPNSSLDDAGDAALARALIELKKRKATVVLITHRSSLMGLTEKILVLRDGLQQAFGPRDEILAALQQAQQQAKQQGHRA